MIVSIFLCGAHGEVELLDFEGQVAFCDVCNKQMPKIAQYEEAEDGSIKDMRDGNGEKLTNKVKVFKCPEHDDMELVDFQPDKAFCPYCGKEMKKDGEYME